MTHWVCLGLAMVGSFRLLQFAGLNSQDFLVYWRAVHDWAAGHSPYRIDPSWLGFVFKYPPWVLPIFLPFVPLSFEISREIWAFCELGFIFYSVYWVSRRTRPGIAIITAFLFWWIWLAHFSAGQFTLALLACALWTVERREKSPLAMALLCYFFTVKLFSGISLAGVSNWIFKKRVVALFLILLGISHVIVFAKLPSQTFQGLYRQWSQTAASGGVGLGEDVIRGQGNHGFTAGVLRWLSVDYRATYWDTIVTLILSLTFALIWIKASRGLDFDEKWAGWLALGVIVHPLAWHHSFVLAYPLCAVSFDRALKRGRGYGLLALLGICCIGIFVPQVIGKVWVRPLELVSIKSWGVIFCAFALVLARMPERTVIVEPLMEPVS